MNGTPSIAFCIEKSLLRRSGGAACNIRPPEPIVPVIKVMLGNIKLRELREGKQAHGQVVTENPVHPIQMSPSRGEFALLFLFFLVPTVHSHLASGLERFLLKFREGTDDVFGINKT